MSTQPESEQEGRIVVGVDGSDPSKAALAWAIWQAKLTGAVVDIASTTPRALSWCSVAHSRTEEAP